MKYLYVNYDLQGKVRINVLPGDALKEWLITLSLDSPVPNWDSDPVETCRRDICEVPFGLNVSIGFRVGAGDSR